METNALKKIKTNEDVVNNLFNQIETIILNNKNKMIYQINDVLVSTYFNIGKTIVGNKKMEIFGQSMVKIY